MGSFGELIADDRVSIYGQCGEEAGEECGEREELVCVCVHPIFPLSFMGFSEKILCIP